MIASRCVQVEAGPGSEQAGQGRQQSPGASSISVGRTPPQVPLPTPFSLEGVKDSILGTDAKKYCTPHVAQKQFNAHNATWGS